MRNTERIENLNEFVSQLNFEQGRVCRQMHDYAEESLERDEGLNQRISKQEGKCLDRAKDVLMSCSNRHKHLISEIDSVKKRVNDITDTAEEVDKNLEEAINNLQDQLDDVMEINMLLVKHIGLDVEEKEEDIGNYRLVPTKNKK